MYLSLNNFDYCELINTIVSHFDLQDEYLTRETISKIFNTIKTSIENNDKNKENEDLIQSVIDQIKKQLGPDEEIKEIQVIDQDGKTIEYGNVLVTFPIILIEV